MSAFTFTNIHEFLYKERKAKGFSQGTLAKALNIEQASVSMYESGRRRIPLNLLDEWLDYLKISCTLTLREEKPVSVKEEEDLERFNELKQIRNNILRNMRSLFAEKLIYWPLTDTRDTSVDIRHMVMYPDYQTYDVTLLDTFESHINGSDVMVQYRPGEVVAFWNKKAGRFMTEGEFRSLEKRWTHSRYNELKYVLLNLDNNQYFVSKKCKGFRVEDLAWMSKIHCNYTKLWKSMYDNEMQFINLQSEWNKIVTEMKMIHNHNRLENGTINPRFVWFTRGDLDHSDPIKFVYEKFGANVSSVEDALAINEILFDKNNA